jgi:ABC-type sugar transport system permease subunit/ABC-type glycerol-3-phosphate transport system permease component
MTTEQNLNVEQSSTSGKSVPRIILGLALLVPAALCCLSGLFVPTIKTFITSLQEVNPLAQEAEFVGLGNYTRLFQHPVFSEALGFTLSMLVTRLLVVAIVPLLLAIVVNQFGRWVRIPVRLLFTVPLVLFAPVMIALTWSLIGLDPRVDFLPEKALADPELARQTLLSLDGLYTFGLACGVGLIFYLAALRGGYEEGEGFRLKALMPLGVSWLIGLLATIALSLQSFSLVFILTRGGPMNTTMTLSLYQYIQTFQNLRFGAGAVVASLILVVLAFLGLIAGLLIVFIGLRLEIVSPEKKSTLLSGMNRPLAIVLLVLLLLICVAIGLRSIVPLYWNPLTSLESASELFRSSSLFPTSPSLEAYGRVGEVIPIGQVLVNTLVPLLAVLLLLQLPITYLGALGIGALRPLGRWSELLLLLFSPWLFVTIGPLSIAMWQGIQTVGALDTLVGLAPPIILSVPILFILTLFFKGQAPKWEAAQAEGQPAAGAFFNKLILPSLPLLALLACVAFFIESQAFLWPLIVTHKPGNFPVTVALSMLHGQFDPGGVPMLAAALTLLWMPPIIFFFLAFGVFQIFYLERLSLSA